jgi:CxxC motif-containing protein (DUF1111 family)
MTLFRLAVSVTRSLGMVTLAWGALGATAAAGSARDGNDQGRELFFREWTPGDARSHGGDGLGPLYNETSCVACHNLGAPGGGGPASKNVEIVTLTSRNTKTDKGELDDYHPGFRKAPSVLLHRFGTDLEYKLWRLRRIGGIELANMAEQGGATEIAQIRELLGLKPDERARTFTNLRRPTLGAARVKGQALLGSVATLSRRNPPPLFGAGLIDSVPVEALRAAAEHRDPEFPEIHGRLNRLKDGRLGRFGWKSQTPSLKDFVESACAMELGLEVPTQHQAKPPLDFTNKANGLDLTQEECDALTAFVASFPAPIEREPAGSEERPEVKSGRALFARVGCAACHLPKLASVAGIYSDLLLHDMGPDLSDSGSYYGAIESPTADGPKSPEWRTPPLWGFRDSGPYLHDGRADSLEEAVALHGGQGARSAKMYFELNHTERLQVQTFLNSLAAPAGERAP